MIASTEEKRDRQLRLYTSGTLNPRRHIYIERPHDVKLLELLLDGYYVNVLSSRQMGKSSLIVKTAYSLQKKGVLFTIIDLAAQLGTPPDAETYFCGLIDAIAHRLHISLDLRAWWDDRTSETVNQRLIHFFRDIVCKHVAGPVVVFLDEIDSTLKLDYSDDLFTAIRGIHNERPVVPDYERLTFCLIGVATPNELIKDRRTTPYNVGITIEVLDFDKERDNLIPLARALGRDPESGARLIERVLYWTGGHPYLTVMLCALLQEISTTTVDDVDRQVNETFRNLDHVSNDVHFQQILRYLSTRLTDGRASFSLYERVLQGMRERDQQTVAHAELKLSGLVKRDFNGYLVVRNRIYGRLFDIVWTNNMMPRLRAGGTVNPRRDVYIERPEDANLLRLLLEGRNVHILAPRQMGKSSLMIRTGVSLKDRGWGFAIVDLSAFGIIADSSSLFHSIAQEIARRLNLGADLYNWWIERVNEGPIQTFVNFFLEVVHQSFLGQVAIFIDEFDAVLRFPQKGDFLSALRVIATHPRLARRVIFCIAGVAAPSELLEGLVSPYLNLSHPLELTDFDVQRDDLTPLAQALSPDPKSGRRLLERVLYWTGGQPFLTVSLCANLQEKNARNPEDVDREVDDQFHSLEQASKSVHILQIIRFTETRFADRRKSLNLYKRILNEDHITDLHSRDHAELALSGLVRHGFDGSLVVRNRVYKRLFDKRWVEDAIPVRVFWGRWRVATAASVVLIIIAAITLTLFLAYQL